MGYQEDIGHNGLNGLNGLNEEYDIDWSRLIIDENDYNYDVVDYANEDDDLRELLDEYEDMDVDEWLEDIIEDVIDEVDEVDEIDTEDYDD